jgi:hypothetical protein
LHHFFRITLARLERFSARPRSFRTLQCFCALSLVSSASTFLRALARLERLNISRTLDRLECFNISAHSLARLERFSVSAHSRSSRTLQRLCSLPLVSNASIFLRTLAHLEHLTLLRTRARPQRFNISAHCRSSRTLHHFCALSLVWSALRTLGRVEHSSAPV